MDHRDHLAAVIEVLGEIAESVPVLFPAHPRTVAHLEEWGMELPHGVRLAEPMDYEAFIALEAEARLVITDSGGVQEETSALGVPCLTYRRTTERPVTVELGTRTRSWAWTPRPCARRRRRRWHAEPPARPPHIPHWDGEAGPRAADAVVSSLA